MILKIIYSLTGTEGLMKLRLQLVYLSFFKDTDATDVDLQCMTKEPNFAYHTAIHGLLKFVIVLPNILRSVMSQNFQELE